MRQKLVREMPPANSMRRRAYYLPLVALAAGSLLFGGARCVKQHKRDAETFTVEKQGDLSRLAVVAAGDNSLVGIDTATFRMEARIHCKDMLFDKAVKLADGGVLVVNDGDKTPPRLYVFDSDCSLRTSISVPNGPITPFIHDNLVFMGCRFFGPSGNAQVAVYQLDNLSHRKTFEVAGRVLRQENFCGRDRRIFLPYNVYDGAVKERKSILVMLDANTLDTTHLHVGEPLEGESADTFISTVNGDSLIILPLSGCRPIVYSIAERRVLAYRNLNEEMGARTGRASGTVGLPIVHDGMLTMLYAFGWDGSPRTIWWVKIRLSDLSIVEAKQVLQDRAEWYAGDDFLTCGRFYVIEANFRQSKSFTATFVDWRTGEVAGQCSVQNVHFNYQ